MLRTVTIAGVALAVAALAWAARGGAPVNGDARAASRRGAEAGAPPTAPGRPAVLAASAARHAPAAATPSGPAVAERARPPRVLEADDPAAFPPLPLPGPHDWLTVHPEPGQTYEEFRRGARREVTEWRRTIRLLVLDDLAGIGVDRTLLVEHLAAYYGLPAAEEKGSPPPRFTTRTNENSGAQQTLTTDVLDWLARDLADDAYCTIAVTTRDLYPDPSWNFVYGQAEFLGRVGVFSFARMHPAYPAPPPDPAKRTAAERSLVLRRCLKVVTHEVGHMFGIEHCTRGLCLMNGSNHAEEMDRQPLHLCPECLHKVVLATGLDVLERYRRLEALYRRAGLAAEADWVVGRVARLAPPPTTAPR